MSAPERAVILASRTAPRFQSEPDELPTSLRSICGVTLIKRQLDAVARAGIKSCVVVVGSDGNLIRKAVELDPSIQISIDWISDQDDKKGEGKSLLNAKMMVKENFLLLSPDHLIESLVIKEFLDKCDGDDKVVMAIDRKVNEIFDTRVTNKIKFEDYQIQKIGRKIKEFDAVDTGMYSCTPEFFTALEKSQRNDKCHLEDGLSLLMNQGKLNYFDIKNGWWFDLDTPGSIERAEKSLLNRLRKPTDGWVSRNLNRPLSLSLSRILMKTPVTGNHVTYFSLVLGLISAGLFAVGSYGAVLAGAILFQILSVLDGCDGELAKLKLQDSMKGQLLDTVIDHITYLAFLVCVTIGYYRQQQSIFILVFGGLTLLNVFVAVGVVSWFSKKIGNYSFVAANKTFFPKESKSGKKDRHNMISWVFSNIKFAIRRDFFAFVTLIAAIFGGLPVIFWVAFIATFLYAVGAVYGIVRYLRAPVPAANS